MRYTKGTVVFKDWVITERVGGGAAGEVFEIVKKNFDPPDKAALKVIRIPKSSEEVMSVMSEGMDENSVTRYYKGIVDEVLREIKVMVTLKGHPNIVFYEDHCVIPHDDGVGWDILIKMELLTPLIKWIPEHPMNVSQVLQLGCEISNALMYAHERNIFHRDVKPQNILVNGYGHFKLGDFGIARIVEKSNSYLSQRGTVDYMAPEVYWESGKYDQIARADIYSLGIVLYSYLNQGRLPFYPEISKEFSHNDRKTAIGRRMHGADIPDPVNGNDEITSVIKRAYAYKPEDRYRSMGEFYDALKTVKEEYDNKALLLKKVHETDDTLPAGVHTANDETVPARGYAASDETLPAGRNTTSDHTNTIVRPQPPEQAKPSGTSVQKKKSHLKNVILVAGLIAATAIVTVIIVWIMSRPNENKNSEIEIVSETQTVDESQTVAETQIQEDADTGEWYYIRSTYKDGIAVRSEPTGESEQLTRLPYGTEFYVEKTDKNWGYTTINGVSGWIALDYAEIIEKEETPVSKNTEANGSTEISNYDQALFYQQCNALLNVNVGDEVKFGAYEQDNNPSNGKEEIEWEVLDKKDNQILVISKKALDAQEYWDSFENTDWEASEMRKWLNESFFQNAFSQYHQSLIMDTAVTADQNPDYQTDTGAGTTDKIYLLSMDEVQRYFPDIESRICQPTVYTKVKGIAIQNLNTWWWLRTSGKDRKHMVIVYFDGEMKSDGFRVYVKDGGVRPAMWINLSDISEVEVPQEYFQEQSECKGIVAINPACVGTTDDTTYMEAMAPGQAEEECTFSTGVTGKVTGVQENQIDLGVAKQLQQILLERGYQVVMLREDDESRLSSANRAIAAAESGADIQILISCRKRQDLGEKGAMAYLPKKENPNVGYMYDDCYRLSQCVLSQYCAEDLFENNGFYETDTSRTINWSKIPITNIMLGCISDKSDEQKMADQNNWAIMAEGIANGIDAYFEQNQ